MLFAIFHWFLAATVLANLAWAFWGAFRYSRSTPRRTSRFALGAIVGIGFLGLITGVKAFVDMDHALQTLRERHARLELSERIDRLGPLIIGYSVDVRSNNDGLSTFNVIHERRLAFNDFTDTPIVCICLNVVAVLVGLGGRWICRLFEGRGPPGVTTSG